MLFCSFLRFWIFGGNLWFFKISDFRIFIFWISPFFAFYELIVVSIVFAVSRSIGWSYSELEKCSFDPLLRSLELRGPFWLPESLRGLCLLPETLWGRCLLRRENQTIINDSWTTVRRKKYGSWKKTVRRKSLEHVF